MEVLFIQGGVKRAVLEVRNWFYQVILKKKTLVLKLNNFKEKKNNLVHVILMCACKLTLNLFKPFLCKIKIFTIIMMCYNI